MTRLQSLLIAVLLMYVPALSIAQESHLTEAGSGAILARSAFAHGYRHGYEEGYHCGNIDINMGRPPQAKLNKLRGVNLHYASEFGPKKSFEAGFHAGLQAGYGDGYAGRFFRAVASSRELGKALDGGPVVGDPTGVYFDQGLAAGYSDGFERVVASSLSGGQLSESVACAGFHPGSQKEAPAEGSYCEGYRRGYSLGRTDAMALGRNRAELEASR